MKGFQNILVPLDGSENAEQAITVAGAIARRSDGTLRLVGVEEPLPALALASCSPENSGWMNATSSPATWTRLRRLYGASREERSAPPRCTDR